MATFTTSQAAQIRMYLGYPDLYRYKDPRLESILGGDQMSTDAIALVLSALAQLAANDAKLFGTGGNVGRAATLAGLARADKVEFFQEQAIRDWQNIGRQLVTRISNTLGVPMYGDAFGDKGYPGDSFSGGFGGQNQGSGNEIPLG